MTHDEAKRWHTALASVASQLSIAIARRSYSPRMIGTCVAMLRPVMREMEVENIRNLAIEKVTREAVASVVEKPKPQRQKRKR